MTTANRLFVSSLVDRIVGRITNALVISALRGIAEGIVLGPAQVTAISEFLDDPDCPFSAEEVRIVRKGLLAQDEGMADGEEEGQATTAASADAPRRYRRYLEVHNTTSEAVTVRLQYLTIDEQDQWIWVPAAPGRSERTLTFKLDPGEKTYLQDDGDYLAAHRVRIWAASDGGMEWVEFQNKNLELIDIDAASGERCYYAEEMETFTYTLQ